MHIPKQEVGMDLLHAAVVVNTRPNAVRVARRVPRKEGDRLFVVKDYGHESEAWEEVDEQGYLHPCEGGDHP
jgi:hypothetical protein